jgi:hypothetical protein
MSPQGGNAQHEQDEEFASASIEPTQSTWKTIWQNNKGMFLILISEMAGSSMDAIVRFLQQGGSNSMHPFQVRDSHDKEITPESSLTPTDNLRSNGNDLSSLVYLHVVDESARFSVRKPNCPGLADSTSFVWIWGSVLLVL